MSVHFIDQNWAFLRACCKRTSLKIRLLQGFNKAAWGNFKSYFTASNKNKAGIIF